MSDDASRLALGRRRAKRLPRTAGARFTVLSGIAAFCLLVVSVRVPDRLWRLDPCAQLSQPLEGRTECYSPDDQAAIASRYGKPLLDPSASIARAVGVRLSALYTFQAPRTMPGFTRPTDPITNVTFQYGAWQGAGCGTQTIVRSLLGYRWFPSITVPPYVTVDESRASGPFSESTVDTNGATGAGCSVWVTTVYAPRHRIALTIWSNISRALTERIADGLARR